MPLRQKGNESAIAIRGTKPGRGPEPIKVQAQVLRDLQAAAPAASLSGFALAPSDESGTNPRSKAAWRKADLQRAIAVAEEAGLKSYRVEIAPDGTITIIVDGAEG